MGVSSRNLHTYNLQNLQFSKAELFGLDWGIQKWREMLFFFPYFTQTVAMLLILALLHLETQLLKQCLVNKTILT